MSVADPAASTSPASTATQALRAAAERGDADAVADLLAPDVVFHSPMTERVTFVGREEVAALHRDIFAVLDGLETTDPLALGDSRSFSFRAQVRGVELEAHVLLHVNEQGQIDELKIFVRPFPALATLFGTLPPRVSARRRGPLTGTVAAIVTWPLAVAVRTADRFTPRFL
ncbi:nuclear transport factor 2 family protein [Kribbella sp. NBC_01245]|uniref:nuclear transport factor 2 family protein n=1 Tax=Kribbella sp. NBC_01245 TaxID=2903578 RepID=UPI002E2B6950|nr:nuclear transport factor 2 family protein [Kribbella sp. NBC_01245]